MAKKPSFFERLTGTVNVDDYGVEETIEVETLSEAPASPDLEDDWMEEENNEGQLTVDVYQNPDEIIIKALVAGVRPENLDVSITRDMVTIKGKREEAKQVTEDNYFYKELYWGSFSRTILLPQEIEVDESTASEKHGLLTLVMPKVNKEKQTKLKIKTG
ncbi:Hsp20/alpha crystallin family protein [bacterium]|nr:Hsp20/alpha crystallin family protein [bacterium]MBT3730033.1 Hsp20/alpha crystallin family protein [bacterium]MBT4895009.1 Hsp20/alpha crystallin family protein [bacterium]